MEVEGEQRSAGQTWKLVILGKRDRSREVGCTGVWVGGLRWHKQLCVVSQLCELNREAKRIKDWGNCQTVGGRTPGLVGEGGMAEEARSEVRELQKVREERRPEVSHRLHWEPVSTGITPGGGGGVCVQRAGGRHRGVGHTNQDLRPDGERWVEPG